ncbi:MAG: DNA repair protein RecO [Candidatus Acidiferrales bacterium]
MPLRDSEAIILRSYSLGEADRLVSFLSRSMGRMRGVAQGARRPKSKFGSSLEMLSHVRIWWYERETRELVRISQCELDESFLAAHSDYECGVALGLISEVTETILPEREASDAAFRLLLLAARAISECARSRALDVAAASRPPLTGVNLENDGDLKVAATSTLEATQTRDPLVPVTYFCLWTVKLGGWMPELNSCTKCKRDLQDGAFASAMRPGMLCTECRLPGYRALKGSSIKLARRMFQEKLEVFAQAQIDDASLQGLRDYLLDVIEHHAEKKLKTRRMLEPKQLM